MLELVKTYEIAIGEKNKFLRAIYISYIKWKLKKIFFNKFDYRNIEITEDLLREFFNLHKCIDNVDVNKDFPYVKDIDINMSTIKIDYYIYTIHITIDKNYKIYFITVIDRLNGNEYITIYPENNILKTIEFMEIINIVIYNYCVSYIYGNKSKLFIINTNILYFLKKLYI